MFAPLEWIKAIEVFEFLALQDLIGSEFLGVFFVASTNVVLAQYEHPMIGADQIHLMVVDVELALDVGVLRCLLGVGLGVEWADAMDAAFGLVEN